MIERHFLINYSPCFQMELVARFPPSEVENLPIWQPVLLRALSQDARHCVETNITVLTQKALSDWQNGGHRLEQVEKMVSSWTVLEVEPYSDICDNIIKINKERNRVGDFETERKLQRFSVYKVSPVSRTWCCSPS